MPRSKRYIYKTTHVRKGNLLSRAVNLYERQGLYYVIRSSPITILEYLSTWYYNIFRSSESFEFHGNTYRYLFHPYCTTSRNERAVVIPIIWDIVKKYREREKRILEVGNMLSYYFKVDHDILDKYEIVDRVINEDVVHFNPSKRYDLIVSSLTLTHVGWDEDPRDPNKVLHAINNLKRLLAPGGQLVVALGLGYNLGMDGQLKSGELRFDEQYYLKRISGYRWKEVDRQDLNEVQYDYESRTANAVLIGVTNKN